MKIGKRKKRSYTVNGRQMEFSQEEIEEILKQHFPEFLPEEFEEAEKPTEGKCFRVDVSTINQYLYLFLKERNNSCQERCRKIILEAIKAEKQRDKVFYLLIPKKKWVYGDKVYISVEEAINFARKMSGHIGSWVEEVLGWAQRIINERGTDEAWENVCNNLDTLEWYRLIIWKSGCPRRIGGSRKRKCCESYNSASVVFSDDYSLDDTLDNAVPVVVLETLLIGN